MPLYRFEVFQRGSSEGDGVLASREVELADDRAAEHELLRVEEAAREDLKAMSEEQLLEVFSGGSIGFRVELVEEASSS